MSVARTPTVSSFPKGTEIVIILLPVAESMYGLLIATFFVS